MCIRFAVVFSILGTFATMASAQNSCMVEDRLTVTSTSLGSPHEGPYLPGEFVTFSYTILNYRADPVQSGNQCQWLQGVIPVFGNAWDPSSFFASGRPRARTRPSSIWRWFTEDSVKYNYNNPDLYVFEDNVLGRKSLCYSPFQNCDNGTTAGASTPLPAGWFVTTEDSRAPCEKAGEDPNDSWGIAQACGTNANHGTFTFTLQVKPYDDPETGCLQTGFIDASVAIFTFTDAEIGCFVGENTVCSADAPTQWQAEVRCVPSGDAIRYYNQSFPVCGIQEWESQDFQLGSQPEYEGHSWPGCDLADSLLFPNWFTFVAQEENMDFSLEVTNCFDGNGVRWAIYELPCDQTMGVGQGSASPGNLGPPITGCNSASTDAQGQIPISFSARTGQLYGLLLEGIDNDICSIRFQINHANELPSLSDSTLIEAVFDATEYGFLEDTVCLGAENVIFSTEPLQSSCLYQWRLRRSSDSNFNANFRTDEPILLLDFPIRDQYELCVRTTNYCDTTAFSCTIFEVVPGASSFLTIDTICQGSGYSWFDEEGELIREIPPQNEAGVFSFTEFLDNNSGCNITANLDLLVQRVNEDDPTVVDTFICYEEAQTQGLYFFCDTLQEPDTIDLQACVSPFSSCDTFFTIHFDVLGGPLALDMRCPGDGNIVFEWKDPMDSGYSSWNKQLQLFEEKENLDWIAEWRISGGPQQSLKSRTWTVSQTDLENASSNGQTTDVILDIHVLYKGEIFCTSQVSRVFDLQNNFPSIDRIEGPKEYCLGEIDLAYFARFTNPKQPQHDKPGDAVSNQLWTIPQGFSFQSPTNASSDTIRLLAPDNADVSSPFVCFSVETRECRFTAQNCIPLDRRQVDVEITPLDQCGQYVFAASLSGNASARSYAWSINDGVLVGSNSNPIVFVQSGSLDSSKLSVVVESDCQGVGERSIPPASGSGILTDLEESSRSFYRRSCLGSTLFVLTEPGCAFNWGFVDTVSQNYEYPIVDENGEVWSESYLEVPDSVSASRIYFVERRLNCSDECESELISFRSSRSVPCDPFEDLILSPNPNQGHFTIRGKSFSSGKYVSKLFSMDGRKVYEQEMNLIDATNKIDLKVYGIFAGSYIFVLRGPGGFSWQSLIIVASN